MRSRIDFGSWPAAGRVVVDDVHDHAQAGAVDALDHAAELERARRPVGVGRVGALGRRVVQRVVAPVEAVLVGDRLDARLLLRRVGRERGAGRTAGSACAARSSSIVAMSLEGSRCSVFIPARARPRRWRMPSLPASVKAR